MSEISTQAAAPAERKLSKDKSESSPSHLARVRENQRRSRARRKEYLSDLEEKFRRCEQVGVEASAEMQAAARRVLDENMKLRAFLLSKGFKEDDLDSFATSQPHSPRKPTPKVATSPRSAAHGLETLLTTKKPCCISSNDCSGSVCLPASPAVVPQISQNEPNTASTMSPSIQPLTPATANGRDWPLLQPALPSSHSRTQTTNPNIVGVHDFSSNYARSHGGLQSTDMARLAPTPHRTDQVPSNDPNSMDIAQGMMVSPNDYNILDDSALWSAEHFNAAAFMDHDHNNMHEHSPTMMLPENADARDLLSSDLQDHFMRMVANSDAHSSNLDSGSWKLDPMMAEFRWTERASTEDR